MAEYFAKPALWGYEAYEKAKVSVSPVPEAELWLLLAPLNGHKPKAWPALGEVQSHDSGRLAWFGAQEALWFGPRPDDFDGCGVSRQTGAWVGIEMAGLGAEAALARLLPLDLRLSKFAPQRLARTQAGNIPVFVIREGEQNFTLYAPRSMVQSLWSDIAQVLAPLAARQAS